MSVAAPERPCVYGLVTIVKASLFYPDNTHHHVVPNNESRQLPRPLQGQGLGGVFAQDSAPRRCHRQSYHCEMNLRPGPTGLPL